MEEGNLHLNLNGDIKRKSIFIPFNTPSSKNSKVATSKGVFHSKTTGKYLSALGIQSYSASRKEVKLYKTKPLIFPKDELMDLFKDVVYPCRIGIHFVRSKRNKFDFHNLVQVIFDIMVAFDIIEDDNMDCALPFPMQINNEWYSIDKDNPGVWITILE